MSVRSTLEAADGRGIWQSDQVRTSHDGIHSRYVQCWERFLSPIHGRLCSYDIHCAHFNIEDIARGVEELCKVKPPGDEVYVAPPYPTPPHPCNPNLNRPAVPVLFPRSLYPPQVRAAKLGFGEQQESVGHPTSENLILKEIVR